MPNLHKGRFGVHYYNIEVYPCYKSYVSECRRRCPDHGKVYSVVYSGYISIEPSQLRPKKKQAYLYNASAPIPP